MRGWSGGGRRAAYSEQVGGRGGGTNIELTGCTGEVTHPHSHARPSCPPPPLLRELGVAGSYTMEASLGGKSADRTHFNTRDYLSQGRSLGR